MDYLIGYVPKSDAALLQDAIDREMARSADLFNRVVERDLMRLGSHRHRWWCGEVDCYKPNCKIPTIPETVPARQLRIPPLLSQAIDHKNAETISRERSGSRSPTGPDYLMPLFLWECWPGRSRC